MRSDSRAVPADLQSTMKKKGLREWFVAKSGTMVHVLWRPTTNVRESLSLLSNMHQTMEFHGDKKKLVTVMDHDSIKFGVDVFDQMACQCTCNVASRR